MGGTTIRYLEYLLHRGNQSEVDTSGTANVSPLFLPNKPGGGNWIQSVFTMSTPFDGSPLHTILFRGINFQYNGATIYSLPDFLRQLVIVLSTCVNLIGANWLYDFDLHHFGLTRQSGESLVAYANRVVDSSIWTNGAVRFD
jgi:triacylglycerol lipase